MSEQSPDKYDAWRLYCEAHRRMFGADTPVMLSPVALQELVESLVPSAEQVITSPTGAASAKAGLPAPAGISARDAAPTPVAWHYDNQQIKLTVYERPSDPENWTPLYSVPSSAEEAHRAALRAGPENMDEHLKMLTSPFNACMQRLNCLATARALVNGVPSSSERDGPGTPGARLRYVSEIAERYCGHDPFSSRPPELAIEEALKRLTPSARGPISTEPLEELIRLAEDGSYSDEFIGNVVRSTLFSLRPIVASQRREGTKDG